MRAIGYTRVSTTEQAQDGAGLAAQEYAIRSECERRGWELLDIYTDTCSGGTPWEQRQLLRTAITEIEAGFAEVLVVAKLDRLSRSTLDFATLLERSRSKKWPIVLLDFGLDLTTPVGEMVANILAAVAQFERRRIGERTKEGLARKKADGVKLGRRSTVEPVVRAVIVEKRELGWPFDTIAALLNRNLVPTPQGGYRWRDTSVRAVYRAAKRDAAPE